MNQNFSDSVREMIDKTLTAGGFEDAETAAWEVSLTVALAKVSSYERECGIFREKYKESLPSFRKRVEAMVNKEDFTLEDDLADWEFAEKSLTEWKGRVEVLRSAAT